MSYIPYKSRAGEEGFFSPKEMSTLEIFAEITAFEHAYYVNNCDPTFQDYFLYAGSATGKLLFDQPGMFGDFEGTLTHWKDELRRLGPELDIYGFSYLASSDQKRKNGKPELGFVVYVESRKHPAQVFYVPIYDAEEVLADGGKVHPMLRKWTPSEVRHLSNPPKGWFLLNDEAGNPVPSLPALEPEFVAFGPPELALRNLGNVLSKSESPFHAALILTFTGAEDKHLMVEADDVMALHHRVWDELHDHIEANPAFHGYALAVDAFITEEAGERNQVYLVQTESRDTLATLKAYKMNKIEFGGQTIGLLQDFSGKPVFERPPTRTLFVEG